MGLTTRRRGLLAWLAPMLLLCAAAGAECETWVLDSDNAEDVRVAMHPDGRAVVVWGRHPLARSPQGLWARRFVPGAGFTPAARVGDPLFSHQVARPALDAFGNGFVSWSSSVRTDSGGFQDVVWATRLDWAEGWQQPEIIGGCPSDDCAFGDVELAMAPDGSALVVWPVWDPYENFWASRFVPGHGWGPPQQVDRGDMTEAYFVRVAAGGHGFLVVWNGRYADGTQERILARWLGQDGAWGEEHELSRHGYTPAVAMGERGAGVVAWAEQLGGLAVDWFDPEAGWQGTVALFQGLFCWDPAVVVDGYGGAAMAWRSVVGDADADAEAAWVDRFVPGQGWQVPLELRPAGGHASDPVFSPILAGNAAGEIVVVWHQVQGSLDTVWCRRFGDLAGWSPAEVLASGERQGFRTSASAAMNEAGDALVVWTLGGRLEGRVWPRPEPQAPIIAGRPLNPVAEAPYYAIRPRVAVWVGPLG